MLFVVPAVLVLNEPSLVFSSGSRAFVSLQSVEMGLWQPCGLRSSSMVLGQGSGREGLSQGRVGKAAVALA